MTGKAIVIILTALTALAGCGRSAAPGATGEAGQSAATADVGALTVATHNECARLGTAVVTYLRTGDNQSDPGLDQLAAARATILSEPVAAQDGLVRAEADHQIEACDQRLAAAEQAQAESETSAASAEAAESAAAADAAAKAAADQAYDAACTEHSGHIGVAGTCVVDYPGWLDQDVTINSDGSWNADAAKANRANCADYIETAKQSAREGSPWSDQPKYHADTGVCVIGNP